MDLVKTVGAPVRDKRMADGVVKAWGVMTPLLRQPGNATHTIWYAVEDYAAVEKVDSAMRAQIVKLTEESSKSGVTKEGRYDCGGPNGASGTSTSKTRDFLTRDIVFGLHPAVGMRDCCPIPDSISSR